MTNTIGFPGLGLEFEINRVAFNILGKDIFWYALIIMTGFILGVGYVMLDAKKNKVKTDHIFDIAIWGLVFGIICARIYYVIFDPACLRGNIWNVFAIWDGGIAIYGGIIGAVLTAFIYCKKNKLKVLKIFDLCSPGLFIGQIIGRWGNFVNAEVFGRETTLPWRMTINGSAGVHPLFLYESLWNLLGFLLVHFYIKKRKTRNNRRYGEVFFFYLLWYGAGRLFLEGMRQPQYILYLIPGVLGISQLVAFLVIIASAIGLVIVNKKK